MSRKVLLFVDDDRDKVDALAALFSAFGHATATAINGVAAVSAALELRPDLIVLDVGLPGMNGLDVLRHVRSDARGAHVPVIILSGRTLGDDAEAARRLGCSIIFRKPCETQTLRDAVEALLLQTAHDPSGKDAS